MCGLIADLLVCLRAKNTKQMTSTDILDISECLEDAPSRWLLMMLPQDTSCLMCLFLCWHHTTIRLLDYHGDSSSTQFGRFATRSWVARPKLTYLPLSPHPVSAEEDAAGDQARPRPTLLPLRSHIPASPLVFSPEKWKSIGCGRAQRQRNSEDKTKCPQSKDNWSKV